MKINFIKQINIFGLRYPKMIFFQNQLYVFGSKLKQRQVYPNGEIQVFNEKTPPEVLHECKENQINKYSEICYVLDNNFNIIEIRDDFCFDKKYKNNIMYSTFIRNVVEKGGKLYFNVEFKENINNKYFINNNKQFFTTDVVTFQLEKEYENTNFLYVDDKHILFTSKIEKDEQNPDYFWGKYLFEFIHNDKKYNPYFDSVVDYKKDKGHKIHNIIQLNTNEYIMLFTIRHYLGNNEHKYEVYTSKTSDFVNFQETNLIEYERKEQSLWLSYPHLFEYNNKWFMISNQNDFGKWKEPIIFQVENW